ncbi:MAG: tetratricopeptide repeat protein [Caldilineaceae bacterium]|nr:tetratricopeptide repeat protein [Caldilineaceae bacterium]
MRRLDQIHLALEGLYHFYMIRSWLAEGIEVFSDAREALEADEAASRAPRYRLAIGRLLTREAKFLLTVARFQEAKDLLLRGLELLCGLNATAEIATARCYLGGVYTSLGLYTDAEQYLVASLTTRREVGDRWGQAVTLLELAGLSFYRGDYGEAKLQCEEGLALATECGDLQTIAHLLTGLSIVHRQLSDYDRARMYVERGQEVYAALDSPYGLIQSLLTLGGLAMIQGRYDEAKPAFLRSLEASQEIGLSLWGSGQLRSAGRGCAGNGG